MEKSYGIQTLEDIINEQILESALSDVEVDKKVRDEAYRNLDSQLSASGSVAASALRRGKTVDDLRRQIDIDLRIAKLLKDRSEPTEAEIENEYSINRETVYKEMELSQVREEIVEKVRERKLNEEFSKWFEQIKSKATIVNYGL